MAWTEAQQKVIDTRNKNLLVSAAAGSGKTAVLVERIISMISDEPHPLDIDHLLVVTFTNTAAAEMRERIGKALDERLVGDPTNEHLQKQLSLLQSAQITTIHSFCLNILRNYFNRIDLDPSFKIAEESEMTLMKSDVISEILERWYEEGREDFHEFIESYSYSKSDAPIEELVLQIYQFSMSASWPKVWIAAKKSMFGLQSLDEMYQTAWMKELLSYIDLVLSDLLIKNAEAIRICNEPGGPAAYLPALLSDRNTLEVLTKAESYQEYAKLFMGVTYDRLSGKKEDGVDPWKKEKIKALREEVKKAVKDLTSQYFFQSPEEMLKDLQSVNQVMQVLFDLTLEFMEEFAKKKEEKNLVDFNDLEHFALKILVKEKESGEEDNAEESVYEPTQAALELNGQFEEILIDEYQDSNMVQETILKSISREDAGCPNRFMVGDVKQSIYKFRLAMPEIFMEKYEKYTSDDSSEDGYSNHYQKIDLDKNFRSRKPVLDFVNHIFEQIMQKSVGGIVYDETAALKYGETYDIPLPEADHNQLDNNNLQITDQVDILLVTDEEISGDNSNSDDEIVPEQTEKESASQLSEEGSEELNEAEYTKKEIEARVIATKIKEIVNSKTGMMVYDKSIKSMRPAEYKDIVILLRSMANWSEVLVKTLMGEAIPAYADTGTGYFQTAEVMAVLNMLRIIDNPRQDIPLAGVLYSPMVGLTTTQLAMIKATSKNTGMYPAIAIYAEEGSDEVLRGLLSKFIIQLETYRRQVNHKPIHEIIQMILDQTGYYYYVSAMPGGDQRKANINMLVSRAVRFEKGSYSGLFHFIRYIEKLHKYEVDFGEATTYGEQDNTVRIMSIHKSKGLEFPIVILAGMGKQFNTQDIRNNIVLHSDMGVGPEFINSKLRTKIPTLLKKVIQKKVQTENLGEELRVLYVAMTRAREKLILTGYIKSLQELQRKEFTFYELLSAKNYINWVLPAVLNCMGRRPVIDVLPYSWTKNEMSINVIHQKDFLKQEVAKQLVLLKDEEELLNIKADETYDIDLREEIKSRINFIYPYKEDAALKIKMTVSELKKLGQFQDEEQSIKLFDEKTSALPTIEHQENMATIPGFVSKKDIQISGTDRGTLYHKVLELLDLTKVRSRGDLVKELGLMADVNQINQEDIEKLKQEYIYGFVTSNVAERMRKAQQNNKLYKEKQFVIGMKASEVLQGTSSNELILIQGIVDVYFEEDGELVLLDYKSDLARDEDVLVIRYKTQLDYYRKALEQMLHKHVKEMIIYSLPLAKEIRIDN